MVGEANRKESEEEGLVIPEPHVVVQYEEENDEGNDEILHGAGSGWLSLENGNNGQGRACPLLKTKTAMVTVRSDHFSFANA